MSLRRITAIVCGLALSSSALGGCKASASFKAGGDDEAKSPEAPPPPPKPPKPKKEEPKAEPKEAEPEAEPKEEKGSKVVTKGNTILLPGKIVFDSGQATLKENAGNEEILEQLRSYMEEYPKVTLMRVEGHTDNVGKPKDNLELSGQRALTIKKYLIDKKVDEKRIIAVGFGESKPIADNSTEEGRAQNRRTEFKIAEVNGKPYLGMDPKAGGNEFK